MIKRLLFAWAMGVLAITQIWGQNMTMNPVRFTNTGVRTYNVGCPNKEQVIFKLNGQPFNYQYGFYGFGFLDISWEFGTIKPGDVLSVSNPCGDGPTQQVVKDDYVYIEVPNGTGYTGNGIGPNDTFSPYSYLTTPVQVGKCSPVPFNAHVLCAAGINLLSTNGTRTGTIKINGAPIQRSRFTYSHNFAQSANFTIHSDGSITTDGGVVMRGEDFFSGAIPTTIEYRHNGINNEEMGFEIGGMSFNRISNGQYTINKNTYTGSSSSTVSGNFTNSIFKITYDESFYYAYVDGVLVDSLKRYVVYTATGGTIANSGSLDYRTGTTYIPTTSGTQLITAVVDGVRVVSQKIQVADDMNVTTTVVDAACSGGGNGQITVGRTGGLSPFQYSINGGSYGSGNVFGSLAAGAYTVRVRDASGCVVSRNVTVGQNATLNFSVGSKTDVTCAGDANGSITLNGSGGVAPLTYSKDGTNFFNGNSFGSLNEGNYTFTIKDAAGCTKTTTATVGFQSKIVASAGSINAVSCFGGNNGSIAIVTTGSVPSGSLQFSLNGGGFGATPSFSGLSANTYTITVKDNLCQRSFTATVTQSTDITATLAVGNQVSCFGGNNGSINTTASGGTGSLQYSKDNVTFGGSAIFGNLTANSYKVWVKDANGCTKETNIVTVTQPADLAFSVGSKTDILCFGNNTGSVTLSASGGAGGFTYQQGTGNFQASATFGSLGAGNYGFTLKDANGCQKTTSTTLTQPTNLVAGGMMTQAVSCNGGGNGSLQASASGGTSPYTYSLSDANYGAATAFAALTANTYQVWVRDNNGCKKTASVTVTQPTALTLTSTFTAVKCNGGNDGSVSLTAGGGVGGFTYAQGTGSYQASNTFGTLTANTYNYTVKDANSCTKTINTTVTQPTLLVVSLGVTQTVSCFGGNNGSIATTASGATPAYQYSLDDLTYQAGGSFGSLSTNTYRVWVKDANGCKTQTNAATVTQPADLTFSVGSKTDILCFGNSTGSVTLAASGGVGGYTYQQGTGNFQASATFGSLGAGNYGFTLKDANGCQKTTSTTLTQPTDLVAGGMMSQAVSCNGGNNGALQASASGGTTPYTYSLSDANYGAATTFAALTANTYQVWVRDNNGCKKTASVVVTQPTALTLTSTFTAAKCNGGNDGSVSLTAGGGVGGFTYAQGTGSYQVSSNFGSLTANTYNYTVKDANNCVKTISATVTQPTLLVVSLGVTQTVSCFGGNNGSIATTASGATPAYQYSLDDLTYQSGNSFGSLFTNTYRVWVRDANGCKMQTNAATVIQPTDIVLSVSNNVAVKCFGGNDGVVTLAATGGVGGFQFANGNGNFQTSPAFGNLATNTYTFRVKDGNNCPKNLSVTVTQPTQAFGITLGSSQNLSCYQNTTGRLTVAGSGGTSPYQFSLDNSSFQGNPTFSNLSALTYTVYGKDANNCTFSLPNLTLTQPTDIVVTLLRKKDVNCQDYQRGEFLVGATGSNGNFSYNLSGTDFKGNAVPTNSNNTGLFVNLLAGNYTLQARDQTGCPKDFPVTIIAKSSGIRYDLAKTLPTNCTATDGQLQVQNINGGRAPYQFNISGQANFTTNPTFANLLNGLYVVTVADSLCSYKQTADLRLPNSLNATYNISPVSCSVPTANLQVTGATGGNGGYTWALNGGGFTNNPNYTNLSPNVYQLVVKDNPQSCQTAIGFEIKEQNRADLQLASKTDISCFNGSDGIIKVMGTNNLSPFQYAISNGPFSTNNTFQNLPIGNYLLLAKNSFGCLDSIRVVLNQPTQLTLTHTRKDNDCFNDRTGRLEGAGGGGTTPYQYSIDGNVYQNAPNFEALAANGYVLRVRDAKGCVTTNQVSVNQPTIVTVTPMYQDTVRCFGESNGMVKIMAGGGTPGYQYSRDGQNYFPSEQFGNLPAGNHTFFVKDNKQCVKQNGFTVTQPTVAKISLVSKRDPLCYLDQNGILEVRGSGGNGGYSFQANNGQSQVSGLFTGLTQALYDLKLTDRRGCTDTISRVALVWPKVLTWTSTTQMPRCFGESNGNVGVIIDGGTLPYQATLLNNVQNLAGNTYTFTNLASTMHAISIRDRNGCTNAQSVLLPQPSQLAATIIPKNNDCFDDTTGRIEVVGREATPPYQYALDGQNFKTQGLFTGLKANGNGYALSVRDGNGCLIRSQVPIVQPTIVTVTPMYQDTVRCFGESNGIVKVMAGGGTPGYQYSRDGQNYFPSEQFGNLPAGNYTFYVKDNKQCVKQNSFTVTQPTVAKISLVSKRDPLCYLDQNGIVEVRGSGGNGGYSFQANNGQSQISGLFTGLTQALYDLKLTDRRGCTDTLNRVALVWPKVLTWTSTIQMPRCFGESNGNVGVIIDGGTVPYQATLLNNVQNLAGNSYTFNNLASTSHVISIRDRNGCTNAQSVLLPQPSQLAATIIPKNNDCFDDTTGRIEVLGREATPPYQYALDGQSFKSQGLFTGLKANGYALSVRDKNGCLIGSQVPIVQPTIVTVTPMYQDTVRCFGESNGIVKVMAGGGTPGYQYSRDGQSYFPSEQFGNLPANSYTFYVRDSKQCVKQNSLAVTQPPRLNLRLVSQANPLCVGEQNGVVQTEATGGNGSYIYVMDNVQRQPQGRFEGLTQGEYTFKLLDRKSCEANIQPVVLRWPAPLGSELTPVQPRCVGEANGGFELKMTGGVLPYNVVYNGQTTAMGSSFTSNNLAPGNYAIVVKDANGCALSQSVRLLVPEAFNPIALGDSGVFCKEQVVKLNANNPNRPVKWFYEGTTLSQAQQVEVSKPGLYTVMVSNSTGCEAKATYKLINNNNALKADFLMTVQGFVGDTIYALNVSAPQPDEVIWTLPSSAYSLEANLKRAAFIPTTTGKFPVVIQARKGECFNRKEREIEVFLRKDVGQTNPDLGFADQVLIQEVLVFPNPNYGRFTIEAKLGQSSDVDIYITRSTNAALVYQASGKNKAQYTFEVSLQNFIQDIYVVLVKAGKSSFTKKILVMN